MEKLSYLGVSQRQSIVHIHASFSTNMASDYKTRVHNYLISRTNYEEMLKKGDANSNLCFIIIENATKVKGHEYDEWYSDYLTGEDGIWVGNGVDDQYVFEITANGRLVNNCGPSYGYVINSGQEKMIKLLGIKDKGDEDE